MRNMLMSNISCIWLCSRLTVGYLMIISWWFSHFLQGMELFFNTFPGLADHSGIVSPTRSCIMKGSTNPQPKVCCTPCILWQNPLSHLAWYRYLPVLGCYFDFSLLPPVVPVFWKFWNQRTSSSGFFLKDWTSSFHEMAGSFIEGCLVDPLSILIWSIAVQMFWWPCGWAFCFA